MVTITGYKSYQTREGRKVYSLILQGEVEVAQGKSGKIYLTSKKVAVSTTFNELVCKMMIGKTLSGTIKKVSCEEYEYVNKETGEVIILSHRYQYIPSQPDSTPS